MNREKDPEGSDHRGFYPMLTFTPGAGSSSVRTLLSFAVPICYSYRQLRLKDSDNVQGQVNVPSAIGIDDNNPACGAICWT